VSPAERDLDDTRRWLADGTTRFLEAVDTLTDDAAWDAPTRLPGWRPRELIAHVHHNALALRNLVIWATTGVETPMYASTEQRDADIAATATEPPARLRELVRTSAAALDDDLDEMDDAAWAATVVTAQGRTVPAREIVWMRTREVVVHAIDLDVGVGFVDLPADLVEALVQDVVALRLRRGEGPTLAAWLTGRGVAGEDLGRWI
jgi:maleylpyruvate isomerase